MKSQAVIQIPIDEWRAAQAAIFATHSMVEQLLREKEKEFMSPSDVRSFLGIGKTTYYSYIRKRLIKEINIDGSKKRYVRRSDLDEALKKGGL